MSRRRVAWTVAGAVAVLALVAGVAALMMVRSQWFFEKVRQRVVSTVETATGGRAEIAAFRFDWKRLRAEVDGFTLHGNEPADRPPLVRASSVAIGLKVVSLMKRDVDIQSLDVADPRVYLIVYPDGSTNVPSPKVKGGDRNAVETLLNLAIGRFQASNGLFEVESRGATPFEARGERLDLKLGYEAATPRYRGELTVQPLDVRWPGLEPVALGVAAVFGLEKNRVTLASLKLSTGESNVAFSGAVEELMAPRIAVQYAAHVAVADAARVVHIRELLRGTVEAKGEASWAGPGNYGATGNVQATGVEYRDSTVRITNIRADGKLTADPKGLDWIGVRYAGDVGKVAVSGQAGTVALRGRDLDVRRIALSAEGGTFQGDGQLRDLDRYTVAGNIADFGVKRTVALYSPQALPWDGRAAGTVRLEGSLRRKNALHVSAELTIAPAPQGTPVNGHITAAYDAPSGLLDLGHSTLTLPNSRADFSGSLPGKELRVHLETRDLNDILPVIGGNAADLPVKIESGAAVFDGTVAGDLKAPRIAGHLTTGGAAYEEHSVDSLQADVSADSANIEVKSGALSKGNLRAQFQGSVGLFDWKTDDASAISGSGSVRNADLKTMAEAVGWKDMPATGTLSATAQVSGTLGSLAATADVDVARGVAHDEPFDRFQAHVTYSGRIVQLTNGRLAAGAKQVELAGAFEHAPGHWDSGRVRFQIQTNAMDLEKIQNAQALRPGAKGTVQASGTGELDVQTAQGGKVEVRVADLHADVAARGLQMDDQPFGDAHLTAQSQNGILKGHAESDFAGASILGDGEWQLQGQYPGTATVRFSKLDLAKLPQWLSKEAAPRNDFSGVAEGEVRITGPLLQADALKAELRIPKLEMAAVALAAGAGGRPFAISNSGPIVATLANRVVTVESARLVGRATDLSLSGKVALDQKSPLDLRVNGKLDLGIIHEFDENLVSSGSLIADASVRGPLAAPQLNGRVQFQDAAFSISDLPNGISKANGTVVLSTDHDAVRATIQSLSGETGGGRIEVTGFAGYGAGDSIFRLHARADQVRVRYPEGVSTVANASLNLSGTTDRSELSGTVTILRTGFNPQSDFSSIIAKSAEPVQTPAARTGLLGGLNFDVQIETSPDIQFQSSLAEDVQAEANLRLRGTFSNPAVLGRVTITQGQITFYGTKYIINDGSIAFYNALKVEPVLDINLQTKARGIDITLTVAGPLNKLHLTPRSDPPLQFNEIVALLATGRTPTSDPAMLTQQSTLPQSWQQMGASALLGQAIANPVAGRLQRFFGVSKLRIDPTISGVENNPQARLTLEQQVTPDITFTYITNVTSSNPQVVRAEWAVSKQWSVVLLREENGTFGVDFFFKRRF